MTKTDRDAKAIAAILRKGGYSYQQTKRLFADARSMCGLVAPRAASKSVERLSQDETERLLRAAYGVRDGVRGLMVRVLLETGSRVSAFTRIDVADVDLTGNLIRLRNDKGGVDRDVPILASLSDQLRLHIGRRESGPLFLSPRGGGYSVRRTQQIVKEVASEAGIQKNVYPHLLRHTIAQHLADQGMPEQLLQRFMGHSHPATTQVYYEPRQRQVNDSFQAAMKPEQARAL